MQLNRLSFTRSSLLALAFAVICHAQPGSVPYIAINQAEVDGRIWGIPGDGVTDATAKLQAAITYAVTNSRTLLLRRPSVAYKVTSSLTIGTGLSVIYGFDLVGVGQPRILWAGGASPIFDVTSVGESRIQNIWIDGDSIAGCTGIDVDCAAGLPGQRVTFAGVTIQDCPLYGIRLVQTALATCDYFDLDMCHINGCGVGLRVEGDIRQIEVHGGAIIGSTTYGVSIDEGSVNFYDALFNGNGSGSIYLGSNLASINAFRTVHEDHPVLVGGGTWTSYSGLISPILLCGVKQDLYILPFPAGPAIVYDAYKTLVLEGCVFVQDIDIGTNSLNVVSIGTEFLPFAVSGVVGEFTGHTEKLLQLGRGLDALPDVRIGPFLANASDLAFDRTVLIEFDGSWDNESWPLPIQLPVSGGMTLWDVYAYVVGSDTPTLTFNLEERAAGTINTVGSDIFAVGQVATAAGVHLTAFADSDLAAGSHLWWKTGAAAATGTVDAIKIVLKAR